MTYPWREQEEHYQPWRVKVIKQSISGSRRDLYGYYVAIFNDVTHEIRYLTGDDEFESVNYGRRFSYKGEAIEAAKRKAIECELPYVIIRDEGTYEDFHKGPVQSCLICGKEWWVRHGERARGWDRDVCPDCKKAVQAHEDASAQLVDVVVAENVIAHPGNSYEYQGAHRELVCLLLHLIAPEATIEGNDNARECDIGKADPVYGSSAVIAPMKPWQAEVLRRAIEVINKVIHTAFSEGKKQGSALLEQLVRGEVHPNDFSEIRSGS